MNYEEFLNFCKTRVSYRQFSLRKVDEKTIQKIFKIGQLAPSSCNQQAYKFIVLNKEEDLKILAELSSKKLHNSPQAMFCFTNMNISKGNYDNIQSTAASIMSMLYAAHSLGLGAYWVAGFQWNKKTKQFFQKNYNVPKNYTLQALLLFGYRKEGVKEYPGKCRLDIDKNFLINKAVQEEKETDKSYLDKIMPVYFDRYHRVYDLRLNAILRKFIKKDAETLYLNAFYGTFLNPDIKRDITLTNRSSFANDFLKNKYPQYDYVHAHPKKLNLKKKFKQILILETLNHFSLKETLETALKHSKNGTELIVLFKNFYSTKSLLYFTYKVFGKNHYNQPLEYVRNPAKFLRKAQVMKELEMCAKKQGFLLHKRYAKKIPSDKPILSQKFEDFLPSFTLLIVSLEKENKGP
jgi:nitroreductase